MSRPGAPRPVPPTPQLLSPLHFVATPRSPKWTIGSAFSFLSSRQCPSCSGAAGVRCPSSGSRGGNRRGPPALTRTHMYRCNGIHTSSGTPGGSSKASQGKRTHSRSTKALRAFYFQCPYNDCRALLRGPKMLCMHVAELHAVETHCPQCRQTFGSPVHCRAHVVQHHPDFVVNSRYEFIALTAYHQLASEAPRGEHALLDPEVVRWLAQTSTRAAGLATPAAPPPVAAPAPTAEEAARLEQQMQDAMDASDEEALLELCYSAVPPVPATSSAPAPAAGEIAVQEVEDAMAKNASEDGPGEAMFMYVPLQDTKAPLAEGQAAPATRKPPVAPEQTPVRKHDESSDSTDDSAAPSGRVPYHIGFFGKCFDPASRTCTESDSESEGEGEAEGEGTDESGGVGAKGASGLQQRNANAAVADQDDSIADECVRTNGHTPHNKRPKRPKRPRETGTCDSILRPAKRARAAPDESPVLPLPVH